MGKVIGLGGIFFKCKDVQATRNWYKKHLGLDTNSYGCTFFLEDVVSKNKDASQQWSPFSRETEYFEPSKSEFMVNFRVDDLDSLSKNLTDLGIDILKREEFDYGSFAWILDCDGRKLELWQPRNEHLFK